MLNFANYMQTGKNDAIVTLCLESKHHLPMTQVQQELELLIGTWKDHQIPNTFSGFSIWRFFMETHKQLNMVFNSTRMNNIKSKV